VLKEAADRRDSSLGNQLAGMLETEVVAHTLFADSGDSECNVDQLFKLDCPPVVARRADPRPADFLSFHFRDHAQPEAAKEFVLRLFHVGEEDGEVDDPRHIGIAELDATGDLKGL
jgi:hypothetical protein